MNDMKNNSNILRKDNIQCYKCNKTNSKNIFIHTYKILKKEYQNLNIYH